MLQWTHTEIDFSLFCFLLQPVFLILTVNFSSFNVTFTFSALVFSVYGCRFAIWIYRIQRFLVIIVKWHIARYLALWAPCFNIVSIFHSPFILLMKVVLHYIGMSFAQLWGMGNWRKIRNKNICLHRESNLRLLAFQPGALDHLTMLIVINLWLKLLHHANLWIYSTRLTIHVLKDK